MDELARLAEEGAPHLALRTLGEVQAGDQRFPLQVATLGNPDPALPAIGIFGGVHGLERIGAEVVLAFLRSLVSRLAWDGTLHHLLGSLRMVFMPAVNPVGLWAGTRSNANGVDLMRNSPVDASWRAAPLLGGQRWSAALPWYRGAAGAAMEAESRALCQVVEEELLPRRFSLAVDCHSGFGLSDRLWFPYAHTRQPIEHLPEMHALCEMTDRALLHHQYVFEPQSHQYLTHGDLWDHLYHQAAGQQGGRVFLPLTLEMGSWLWVKKNPRQMFSRHGIFNPLIEHRHQRVLRRHVVWLDLVARLAAHHGQWLPQGATARARHHEQAMARWYRLDTAR